MTQDPWFDNDRQEQERTRKEPSWERDVLEKMVSASIKEQRSGRRWGIFFKLLFFTYVTLIILLLLPEKQSLDSSESHVALIKIDGMIDSSRETNANDIKKSLQSAFEAEQAKAIIMHINSPGGSPVQSGEIYDEINRLKKLHPNKKVYAVIGDAGASGAYYIATAADLIYANQASLVGSIGVLMNGFGFVDSINKLGIERRLITAGDHKGMLDPFLPVKPDELAFTQELLTVVHQQFIDAVKKGRGERLKNNPEIFSGLFWVGSQALDLGLIDGLGDVDLVATQVIEIKRVVDYSRHQSVFDRFSLAFSQTMADTFFATRVMFPSLHF